MVKTAPLIVNIRVLYDLGIGAVFTLNDVSEVVDGGRVLTGVAFVEDGLFFVKILSGSADGGRLLSRFGTEDGQADLVWF